MDIVALYKTFGSEEWIGASLASIYPYVERILIVHSEVSWTGEEGRKWQTEAADWAAEHDDANKVRYVFGRFSSQQKQYRAGIAWLKQQKAQYDLIMVIDADEVWRSADLGAAFRQIREYPSLPIYRSQIYTYIKSPLFRVHPPMGFPVVFLREPERLLESARAWNARPHYQLKQVWLHHFCGVRSDPEDVFRKFTRSSIGDDREALIDQQCWRKAKWDRLPFCRNYHPFRDREDAWASVKVCRLEELPDAVQAHPLVLNAWREIQQTPELQKLLQDE